MKNIWKEVYGYMDARVPNISIGTNFYHNRLEYEMWVQLSHDEARLRPQLRSIRETVRWTKAPSA